MKTVFADERGRITLGAGLLDKYGKKFAVIGDRKEIVLVPIAKDPVDRLAQIGKKAGFAKYSLKQLRKIGREEAEKEAFGTKNVRRH